MPTIEELASRIAVVSTENAALKQQLELLRQKLPGQGADIADHLAAVQIRLDQVAGQHRADAARLFVSRPSGYVD